MLIQYYLLIVEKRSSTHDSLIVQQQHMPYNQGPMMINDEYAKWILEPLALCPLDPTGFLRKEYLEVCVYSQIESVEKRTIELFCFQLKNSYQYDKNSNIIENDNGIRQARSVKTEFQTIDFTVFFNFFFRHRFFH